MPAITVIGAGLAGSEAAWQLAVRGIDVDLVEMRPGSLTPAHTTGLFGELVCSNSFKSVDPHTAPGMLKTELASLGSLVLAVAQATAIPAGTALAVDRLRFAQTLTAALSGHPHIHVHRIEAQEIPGEGVVIVATGPLTSDPLSEAITEIVGERRLSFFDAAAPIVDASTIDYAVCFAQSRYGKGAGNEYLNCPFDKERYERFVDALLHAERVIRKDFEPDELFSACQPIEEIARRGRDALRFGPFKPVGLVDPATGRRPWAALQLRAENAAKTMYNLVGCQTNLTFPEQRRVFRMVPGLESAEFLRYGVMHRNTFLDSPRLLDAWLRTRIEPRVRFAGQMTGTEGYLEAAATGLWAGLAAASEILHGRLPHTLPDTTALGSLIAYATDPRTDPYQPMHANLGLLPSLDPPVREKRHRKARFAERAHAAIAAWALEHEPLLSPGLRALDDTLNRIVEERRG